MVQDLREVEDRTIPAMLPAGTGEPELRRPPARRARGVVVAIAGPDGTGKSTLAEALVRAAQPSPAALHVHHRPGLLPYSSGPRTPVDRPHADPAYGRAGSLAKTLYLFADFALGWLTRLRPHVRRGGWVVVERGWWDLVVDPRRYRLRDPARLARALGRLVPEPDVTFVLESRADVIMARKAELTASEIERQTRAWRGLPRPERRVHLDAGLPPEALAAAAVREVERSVALAAASGGRRWAALPARSNPRWLLPRSPARAAAGSMGVEQAIELRARLGWRLAGVLARVGAFRLLPTAEPPRWLQEALLPGLAGDEVVALARANHPHRWIALVLGGDGSPRRAVKLAGDTVGQVRIAHEHDAIRRFGPSVSAPVSAPAVQGYRDGALTLAAIPWMPRRRPWLLDPGVAFALGRLARAGDPGTAGAWFAHGDVAPWNLLRTAQGWTLLDWEEAGGEARPFDDLFHHLVQSHALLGRPTARGLIDGLRGGGPTWIHRAAAAYAAGAGLPHTQLLPALVEHLRRGIERFDTATDDGRIAIHARRRLLEAAGAA